MHRPTLDVQYIWQPAINWFDLNDWFDLNATMIDWFDLNVTMEWFDVNVTIRCKQTVQRDLTVA
jgi:hypothetical protein